MLYRSLLQQQVTFYQVQLLSFHLLDLLPPFLSILTGLYEKLHVNLYFKHSLQEEEYLYNMAYDY